MLQKDIQVTTNWIQTVEKNKDLNHWTEAETLNYVSNEVDTLQMTENQQGLCKWEEFKAYFLSSCSKEQGLGK